MIGRGNGCSEDKYNNIYKFFHDNYPDAQISICNSTDSESMKIFSGPKY